MFINRKFLVFNCLAFVIIFSACNKPQSLEYRDVRNIQIKSLGFNKSSLSMDLVYFNPNQFGVDLRKVSCDVFVDEHYLGKFQLDTLIHIKRRSEFALPSHIDIEMKGIYKNLYSVLFNKEIKVNVKGKARIGKSGVFINMPFNYSGKHTFSIL
jgi:LEA14-like dessication related protein